MMVAESSNAIRRVLWSGGMYSKRSIAAATGLSIATCNTALNQMELCGEVSSAAGDHGAVGRNARIYAVRDDYKPVLCMVCDVEQSVRVVRALVVSVTGKTLAHRGWRLARLGEADLAFCLDEALRDVPGIAQVVCGVPGIVQNGVVGYCDMPELDGVQLECLVRRRFGLPCIAANDMHLKALGYYCERGGEEEVVTLANFPEGLRPGTATVHKGVVVTGSTDFAGMVGFLPSACGSSPSVPPPSAFVRPCTELIAQCLAAVVVSLNPGVVLCSGSLFNEAVLDGLVSRLSEWLPPELLPEFQMREDLDECYLRGMLKRALDARLDGDCAE